MKFKKEIFLKAYIDCNAEWQKQAEKEGKTIKKQNVKSRNMSIFVKLIENPMKKFVGKIENDTKNHKFHCTCSK